MSDDDVPAPVSATDEAAQHRAHRVAGAIYGTILASSVIAASAGDPGAARPVTIVVVTALVFFAAHVYAHVAGARLVLQRRLTAREIKHYARGEWPMLAAVTPQAGILLLGVVGVLDRTTAGLLALGLGVVILFGIGWRIGRQEGDSRLSSLVSALVGGCFGLMVLLLKVVVH